MYTLKICCVPSYKTPNPSYKTHWDPSLLSYMYVNIGVTSGMFMAHKAKGK